MNKQMKDLRELTIPEIEEKLKSSKDELFKIRHKHTLRQLENTSKLGQLKNTIAQLETVKTEKTRVAKA